MVGQEGSNMVFGHLSPFCPFGLFHQFENNSKDNNLLLSDDEL